MPQWLILHSLPYIFHIMWSLDARHVAQCASLMLMVNGVLAAQGDVPCLWLLYLIATQNHVISDQQVSDALFYMIWGFWASVHVLL